MTFQQIARRASKFAADNSPAILTAIGVTGTLSTAYLTGKASFRAASIIAHHEFDIRTKPEGAHRELELKDKFLLVWREYIPATGVAVMTITCIIAANRIGNRRAAAMAAAYSLSEKAFIEYKDKVVEKIGENRERTIRDEIAQDQIDRNPVATREIIITGNGKQLCLEAFTGRYFESDMETLKKAQNDLNYRLINGDGYASLGEFYQLIGLAPTEASEELGWTSDELLELKFSGGLTEDQRPCLVMSYHVEPIRKFYKFS